MLTILVENLLTQKELKPGQSLPEDCEDYDELIERAQELKEAILFEICNLSIN